MSEVFGAEVELATGDGGAFDVIVDGQTIFSKNKEGRFPEDGEIAKLIRRG